MKSNIIYWTMGDGSKVDIDEMSIYYLRNALKFVVKQSQNIQKKSFSDAEVSALTKKTQYQFENEENIWK